MLDQACATTCRCSDVGHRVVPRRHRPHREPLGLGRAVRSFTYRSFTYRESTWRGTRLQIVELSLQLVQLGLKVPSLRLPFLDFILQLLQDLLMGTLYGNALKKVKLPKNML